MLLELGCFCLGLLLLTEIIIINEHSVLIVKFLSTKTVCPAAMEIDLETC